MLAAFAVFCLLELLLTYIPSVERFILSGLTSAMKPWAAHVALRLFRLECMVMAAVLCFLEA